MEIWQILKSFLDEHTALINLISLSFGFAGIIVAFVIYKASKPVRQLSYSTRTFCIISEKSKKVAGLEVKYNNQNINTLSVTRFAIWNGGSEPIRATDISKKDPLVIKPTQGVKILNTELIETTSSANRSSLKLINGNSSQYSFCFDFLNIRDGVILSFVHDGNGIEDLSLFGTLIGGKIKRTAADPETVTTCVAPYPGAIITSIGSSRSYWKTFPWFLIFTSIIFLAISFIVNEIQLSLISIIMFASGLVIFFYFKRKYPPSKLKMYDDNL